MSNKESEIEVKHFFRLKKVCNDCPFRSDHRIINLGAKRIKGIVSDLEDDDRPFSCHKTTEVSGFDSSDYAQCIGALSFLVKRGTLANNYLFRLAQFYGFLSDDFLESLNDIDFIFNSLSGLVEAHEEPNF